jgi:hypothetical protein
MSKQSSSMATGDPIMAHGCSIHHLVIRCRSRVAASLPFGTSEPMGAFSLTGLPSLLRRYPHHG